MSKQRKHAKKSTIRKKKRRMAAHAKEHQGGVAYERQFSAVAQASRP